MKEKRMMKKVTAIGLIIALLVIGAPLAGAATNTVHNLLATVIDSTSVGVSWSTTETHGPLFTITCQAEGTDRITVRRTYHTYCSIHYLSPETTYIITVSTKLGGSAATTVTIPAPSSYADFNYQMLDTGVYKSTRYETDYAAVTTLQSTTLESELSDYDYSFLFRFKLAATRQNKYLDFELVLRMPNGDVYTIPDVLWYAATRTTVTEYYAFNSALKRIYRDYGSFPVGEYTLTAYIDNGIAAETTFTVE